MEDITTEVVVNVLDIQACVHALEDGHSLVAMEILNEILDNYYEELEHD